MAPWISRCYGTAPRRGRAAVRVLFLGVLLAKIATAAETDNLTYRYVPLEESAAKLDRMVNATLEKVAARANARLRARPDPRSATDAEVELAFVDAYRDAVLRRFDDRLLPVFGACIERDDCPGWPRFERIVLIGRESIY
ncbi:MAG TPA: hypothetical protein VKH46_13260, partial [Thermoanaerobaculia bacterium]|nr:hypothetical protein [Thermoanaerobaculia bacterium]